MQLGPMLKNKYVIGGSIGIPVLAGAALIRHKLIERSNRREADQVEKDQLVSELNNQISKGKITTEEAALAIEQFDRSKGYVVPMTPIV